MNYLLMAVVGVVVLSMCLGSMWLTAVLAPRRLRPLFDPQNDLLVPGELVLNVSLIHRESERFLTAKGRRPGRVVIDTTHLDGTTISILDNRGMR